MEHSRTCERHQPVLTSLVMVGLILAATTAFGAWYDCGQATIDGIVSLTTATTPANRDRTSIGIGETVSCSINADSWKDCDYESGEDIVVWDTIGTVAWSVTGDASISTQSGDATTMTAWLTAGDSSATVTATVSDSGSRYVDTAVVKTKSYTIRVPSGEAVAKTSDPGFPPPGTLRIGAKTIYSVTVQPTTVSFYAVSFREHIPAFYYLWPDGTSTSNQSAVDVAWTVSQANTVPDNISDGPFFRSMLYNAGIGAYIDASYAKLWEDQYCDLNGVWHTHASPQTTTFFTGGTALTCQEIFQGVAGSLQGPWQ